MRVFVCILCVLSSFEPALAVPVRRVLTQAVVAPSQPVPGLARVGALHGGHWASVHYAEQVVRLVRSERGWRNDLPAIDPGLAVAMEAVENGEGLDGAVGIGRGLGVDLVTSLTLSASLDEDEHWTETRRKTERLRDGTTRTVEYLVQCARREIDVHFRASVWTGDGSLVAQEPFQHSVTSSHCASEAGSRASLPSVSSMSHEARLGLAVGWFSDTFLPRWLPYPVDVLGGPEAKERMELVKRGHWQQAAHEAEMALLTDPTNPTALQHLAVVLSLTGAHERAEQYFGAAAVLNESVTHKVGRSQEQCRARQRDLGLLLELYPWMLAQPIEIKISETVESYVVDLHEISPTHRLKGLPSKRVRVYPSADLHASHEIEVTGGTTVVAGTQQGRAVAIVLPNGSVGWVPKAALTPLRTREE